MPSARAKHEKAASPSSRAKRGIRCSLLPLLFALPAAAQKPAHATVVDRARLARIDSVLDQSVRDERLPGGVLLVLRDGQPMYERAFGWSDREAGRRMATNSIFRIASQSKAFTSAAILMLAEEGKLSLGEPVGRYIPSFQKTTVAIKTDTGRAIVPAKRAITIRDLLNHTSGYSYGSDSLVSPLYAAKGLGPVAGMGGWYTADKNEPICTTMETVGTLPAVAQPGEAWVYGYNTDILGCVVEKASGLSLDAFLHARIIDPLGLKDTKFYVNPADRARLATVYASDANNKAVRAPDGARGQGHYVDGPRVSFAGGAGLTSTAADYARFLEMIRLGGSVGGKRYLSPHSVELMRTNQSSALYRADGSAGFGLGFEITERTLNYRPAGSYGWGGAYGSTYWVDPGERLTVVWLIQLMPNGSGVGGKIPALIYQALVTP